MEESGALVIRRHRGDPGDAIAVVARVDDDFSRVVEQHHDRLAQFAFALCGDREQAEQAVVDAYARVWPKFQRGNVEHTLPRLWRAVIHEIERTSRRPFATRARRRRRSTTADATSDATSDAASAGSSTDPTDDDLWAALGRLPVHSRVAIVLYCLDGLSERDAAELLDVPVETLRERAARGVDQLADGAQRA